MRQGNLYAHLVIWSVTVAVVIFIPLIFFRNDGIAPDANFFAETSAIRDDDWLSGNPDSSVLLVEYSDFQCPACAAYAPAVSSLLKELGKEFKFVYRHFPLVAIHGNALLAAKAAEAAGLQGEFFAMSDLLFEKQKSWEGASLSAVGKIFEDYAALLDLDIEKFNLDINGAETAREVSRDLSSAGRLGLNSTPTFFLNGRKIVGLKNYEQFRSLILAEIEKNQNENIAPQL